MLGQMMLLDVDWFLCCLQELDAPLYQVGDTVNYPVQAVTTDELAQC